MASSISSLPIAYKCAIEMSGEKNLGKSIFLLLSVCDLSHLSPGKPPNSSALHRPNSTEKHCWYWLTIQLPRVSLLPNCGGRERTVFYSYIVFHKGILTSSYFKGVKTHGIQNIFLSCIFINMCVLIIPLLNIPNSPSIRPTKQRIH